MAKNKTVAEQKAEEDAIKRRQDEMREKEQARKENLTKALVAEIKATVERYHLVYGLPFEDSLTAQSSMVIATLNSIHPDNQKVLLPQMLDILDQKEKELFEGASVEDSPATATPARPSDKIAAKARGNA